MVRDPKKVFNKTYNTRATRGMVDYDYINRLSEEEKVWLARFSDEYYGSSFEINETHALRNEVMSLLEDEIELIKTKFKCRECKHISETPDICPECKSTDIEYGNRKSLEKSEYNLEKFKKSKEKYVQIYGFDTKQDNLDLRKCRKIRIYYKTENGKYTRNTKHKYSDKNIHDVANTKTRKDCNDRRNAAAIDIINRKSSAILEEKELFNIAGKKILSGEEYLELIDNIKFRLLSDDDISNSDRKFMENLLDEYESGY